jgi:pyruvate formate lyase activating enzyme
MTEIKGFLETSFLDWPGKLCSVLFLPRCNLRCPYCHNHSLILHPEQHPPISLQHILDRLDGFRDWIDGVCVTGGEPTLDLDLPLLIGKLKQHGFPVKLDTNGSNPKMLADLIETGQIDFVSMDVKAPLDPFSYRRSAGIAFNLNLILRSIEILKRAKVEYQFRMTVVPGLHSIDDVHQVGRQLKAGPRMALQNFNPENPMDFSLKTIRPYDQDLLRALEREVQEMT